MNSKQVMDSYGSGAHTRLRHHPLVLSQCRRGGPWVKGKRRYDLAVARKGKSILGLPLKLFWGKCLAGNDIPPKRWKDELESLGACHRS